MPRRTRKQLVGKKEDRERRERERKLEQLAAALHREWRQRHYPLMALEEIERCSLRPYLELFAPRTRPGWDAWGDEVTCDVTL